MSSKQNAALHDREKRLNRVCMREATMSRVLVDAMVDRAMAGKFLAGLDIGWRLIGHQMRFAINLRYNRIAQRFRGYVDNMARANVAFAFNEWEHGHLFRRRSECLVARLAANIAFVSFDNFALTTERPRR